MINKILGSLVVSLLLATSVNASSMFFMGPDSVIAGDTFAVEVWGDWGDEGTGGGGVLLNLGGDAIASIVPGSLMLNPDLGAVAQTSCPGNANCADNMFGWGSFIAFPPLPPNVGPGAGPTLMGSFMVATSAAATEATLILSMADNVDFTGGWLDGITGAATDAPSFQDLSIAVIPLPAAAWLMIGGLGTLLGFRRK